VEYQKPVLAKQGEETADNPGYMQPFLGFKTDKKKNSTKNNTSEKTNSCLRVLLLQRNLSFSI
jgi:hypothetical protein